MSYESVWGIPFIELRRAGFRPLSDQAWAGAKNENELALAEAKAHRMGLVVRIPINRAELKVLHQYTCDMSRLSGRDLGFRWSYLPYPELLPEDFESLPVQGTRSLKRLGPKIPGFRRAGYGYFETESDAVQWKLIAV